jgi:type I restriction enzyme, R subunit
MPYESEYFTRKLRIDQQLKKYWKIVHWNTNPVIGLLNGYAVEEYPTASGPADYALVVNGKVMGIIESKKHGIGAENVLEQAKRYSRGVGGGVGTWGDYHVPFLYSSSGEQVYFLDARNRLNVSRTIGSFHSPEAMEELFLRNDDLAFQNLLTNPEFSQKIRPYQKAAIQEIEKNISYCKRKMMVAMATGTGKTFMTVNLLYRLITTKVAKRILFLVDRKSLAAQAAVAFASFQTPKGFKFNQEYEIFSQRFQKEEIDEDIKFDIGVLPNEYLTKPDASKTFVYVCTIQRMAINVIGKEAAFYTPGSDEDEEADADKIDIPINAFDIIIADECHRGYTSKESNVWRSLLEYFDAIKIGLTATPAAHTTSYFGKPVYNYPVKQAILEGFLVDYEAIKIKSNIRINGVFLEEGEQVGKIDAESGQLKLEMIEDERAFDSSEVEVKVTAPESNRKIIEEIAKHALEFEKSTGRFPKILIFAVNDIQNISHADQLVRTCKDVFNRGDDFVVKITGNPNVDRPLEKIRKFRNRPEPKVVVTVDMLSTGVDIPALEYIVFLRPVKSRILWEQMLGRGTRLCPTINKEKFTIFDCFDGTLIEYFIAVSNFDFEGIKNDTVPVEEIIRRIDNNEDRDYNVKVFIRRLRRIERTMSSEARKEFEPFIKEGDIGKFADHFENLIRNSFSETMKILSNSDFQHLLANYKRPKQVFFVAYSAKDVVSSEMVFEVGDHYMKPEEYLKAFERFVRDNQDKIDEMQIILERPKDWKTSVLKGLRHNLILNKFDEADLQKAHLIIKNKQPDLISIIKHAAREEEPLLEASERVENAIKKLFGNRILSQEQIQWLVYIKDHLVKNLTIGKQDFDDIPALEQHGGWSRFRKVFGNESEDLLNEINYYIAA